MYKYLFGPVPSRRLGISLGVDLVPAKVCSLDCVYCEVGKTTKLTTERMEYVPFEKIKQELELFFRTSPDPDYITFSGSGEPTLNSRLGDVMRFIKALKPGIPVGVLTNGTLLHLEEVRNELLLADLVMPSLDAASQEVFDKINRPDSALRMDEYIEGLIRFRQDFPGEIWLEVFILPGYNDHPLELERMKKAIEMIRPDRVQLNTLDRPGTEANLAAATDEQLNEIAALWNLPKTEIIAAGQKKAKPRAYRQDVETAILETISRRPCTKEDLVNILGLHVNEINKYLRKLESDKLIVQITQKRGVFYKMR